MNASTPYGRAARHYRATDITTAAADQPRRRVELVFSAILVALAHAQRAVRDQNPAVRGEHVGRAMTLIATLRGALDHEAAPEVARRLDALYVYCNRRLLTVSLGETPELLQEVIDLMVTLKSGWDAMPDSVDAAA